jgi:uncharacterized RDD family membrane protein YckC
MTHPYEYAGDPRDAEQRDAFALEAMLSQGTLSRRLAAFVVDGILVVILTSVLTTVFFVFGILTFGLGFAAFHLLPFLAPAYNWLWLMSPLAGTPGQALFGLTVRDEDDLGPPGALAALLWTVGFYASLALSGLPLLLALFNARRRTGHDMISGLVVVRSRALTGWLGTWNMSVGGPPAA